MARGGGEAERGGARDGPHQPPVLLDQRRRSTAGRGIASSTAGTSSPRTAPLLLVIQRLDPIYVDFTITEHDLTAVQRRMAGKPLDVEVRLPDQPAEPLAGKVTFLDNAVQEGTGTVTVRATVANRQRLLWPGRFVKVRLVLATLPQAVVVPAGAPQVSAKGPFVYVVKGDDTAELRPVTPGQRQGDLVVLEQGVKPGERVVVNGQLGVTPGGKVRDRGLPVRDGEGGRHPVNFSEPFIRKPVMTMVLTASVILFGVLAYLQLPVNDLPTVDYPVIQVNVSYPGASPETVASNIATPLERQFMQINGLELVTSKSTQGNVTLTLQFALTKSIDAAATDVQTAISQATGSLPVDLPSPPSFSKSNPNDQPILYIAMTSDSVTQGRLYDYASTQVGQRISILPGVSRVVVFGTKSAIRIKADPSAMWARGISVDDLATAVKNGTSSLGAGQLDGSAGTEILRPRGQLEEAQAYGNLIVGTRNGAPIRLRDVARSRDSVQDERVSMRFWIRGYDVPSATVVVAVYRQAGANAVEVSKSVRGIVPVVNAELPGSIRVTPIYDRARSIVNSVEDVRFTLILAFALVVLVIFLFLGRATDTLIPAVALPLSLLITFMAMRLLGYSLDNLSLMALTLAIGFLVDDAIVFLENTVRRMERGAGALEATLGSAKEISFTIVSMTVSLAAVFLPLVLMSGLMGRIFREFAITIVVAIFASGIVSLTLTPLMCARLLKERGHGARQTWVERTAGEAEKRFLLIYGRHLTWFLEHRRLGAAIWVLCLVGTFVLFAAIPKIFLPTGDSSVVFGVFIAKEGSSPEQMRAYQERVDQTLHADPNVITDFTMTGATGFLSSNQGITFTFLKDPKERPPIQQAAISLMGKLSSIPGLFAFIRPFPVLRDLDGRGRPDAGAVRLHALGDQPGPGLRRRPEADREVLRVPRLRVGLLRLFQRHARPRHRNPPRGGEDPGRLGGAHPDAAPERLFAELPLPHQEARGPVSGDPRGRGRRTQKPRGPRAPLHQVGRREEPRAAQGARHVEDDARPAVGQPHEPVHERHALLQPEAGRRDRRRDRFHREGGQRDRAGHAARHVPGRGAHVPGHREEHVGPDAPRGLRDVRGPRDPLRELHPPGHGALDAPDRAHRRPADALRLP